MTPPRPAPPLVLRVGPSLARLFPLKGQHLERPPLSARPAAAGRRAPRCTLCSAVWPPRGLASPPYIVPVPAGRPSSTLHGTPRARAQREGGRRPKMRRLCTRCATPPCTRRDAIARGSGRPTSTHARAVRASSPVGGGDAGYHSDGRSAHGQGTAHAGILERLRLWSSHASHLSRVAPPVPPSLPPPATTLAALRCCFRHQEAR